MDNDDFILRKQQNNLLNYYVKNKTLASVGDFQIGFEILNKNKLHGNKVYFFLKELIDFKINLVLRT